MFDLINVLGERPYECCYCQKRFTRTENLKMHVMRLHDVPEPLICKYCGNMYKEREEYQNHCANEHLEDEMMLDSSGMDAIHFLGGLLLWYSLEIYLSGYFGHMVFIGKSYKELSMNLDETIASYEKLTKIIGQWTIGIHWKDIFLF